MTDDKAAELLAAVRAVESGERSAASFFTEPAPAQRPPRAPAPPAPRGPRAAAPGPAGGTPVGPVTVPDAVRAVLAEGGAPEALAAPVVEALGEQADEVLRADPWQLLAAVGVRPEQADGFARALLGPECGPGDERRTQALVGWLLERAARGGHTVMEPAELAKGLAELAVPDPEEAVREAVDAGAALVFEDELEGPPGDPRGRGASGGAEEEQDEAERPVHLLMGLDRYALAEESLADGLARLAGTCVPPVAGGAAGPAAAPADGGVAAASREAWDRAAAAAPPGSAGELIRAVADHGVVAHTGGEAARAEPAALVAAARRMGLRAYAAAHSVEGRERLARLVAGAGPDGGARRNGGTGPGGGARRDGGAAPAGEAGEAREGEEAGEAREAEDARGAGGVAQERPDAPAALTVAGLLAEREGPPRGADGAWEADLLVLCDAPQLDAETAAAVVESLPDGARLVLSGDPMLLGSAGPGQVLADVLAARTCPHVASRTPDPGPVGELVSGIGVGELSQVEAPGKEVVIVPVRDAGEAVHRTVQLVADSVPRALGVPVEHTQVVVPGHGGGAGTRALNAALKERLNPGPGRFGGFDPGDRVAHSPVPGRTALATVRTADEQGLHLEYAYTGEAVVVPRERVADTVRHGWAVTAHQAVGTRWPAAVVVLPGDARAALTREWVYTAFSRGERHLSVVHGAEDALPQAVASVTVPPRTTRLRTLLLQAARAAASPAEETAAD